MAKWQFTKGLHEVGRGIYAYLQPSGSWGWSNAGLICDGEASLLVDTLFDGNLTYEMLKVMRDAVPCAEHIGTIVNTHANGDHCFGNGCVPGAEIISSKAGAEEMIELLPETLAQMMGNAPQMGEVGKWLLENFSDFDFNSAKFREPTQTFTGELKIKVGDKLVNLIEVGPAHTKGDVLVHVPDEKVVYTGDILFIGGTPIIWEGPVDNWINACERIMKMDVDVIVPGHGPITDKVGVKRVRDYFVALKEQARIRFDAGMDIMDAAKDIKLSDFDDLGEKERIAVNVATLYREFKGETQAATIPQLLGLMATMSQCQKSSS